MKFANVAELKNHTSRLLRQVRAGQPVVITRRGKPCAAIQSLTESEMEDFLFPYSETVRAAVAEAEADIRAGRYVTHAELLAGKRTYRR